MGPAATGTKFHRSMISHGHRLVQLHHFNGNKNNKLMQIFNDPHEHRDVNQCDLIDIFEQRIQLKTTANYPKSDCMCSAGTIHRRDTNRNGTAGIFSHQASLAICCGQLIWPTLIG